MIRRISVRIRFTDKFDCQRGFSEAHTDSGPVGVFRETGHPESEEAAFGNRYFISAPGQAVAYAGQDKPIDRFEVGRFGVPALCSGRRLTSRRRSCGTDFNDVRNQQLIYSSRLVEKFTPPFLEWRTVNNSGGAWAV